jgi:hypothetical protein
MKLLLDDQPCPCDVGTIGEAIAEGASIAQERGRMVVEVLVDGVVWDDETFADPAQSEAVADEVHLISADRVEMVVGVMNDAVATLDQIEVHQIDAANLIDAGDESGAMRMIGEAIAMWSAIHQAVQLTGEVVPLRLDEPIEGLGPAVTIMNELTQSLSALKESIVRHDFVVVGDVLRYEMPNVLTRWRDLLRGLRERVIEEPGS